jgi:hypothetical protein
MSGPNDPVDFEELTLANTVSVAALLAVLERKGLLTKNEVLVEVDRIKKDRDAKIREN